MGPVLGLHRRTREVMENLAAENSATKSPYARIREVIGQNPILVFDTLPTRACRVQGEVLKTHF